MINLNTSLKMPNKVLLYYLLRIIVLTFCLFIILSLPGIQVIRSAIVWLMILFINIPVFIILFLQYINFSFIIKDNDITVKSGILVKRSKLISFDRVQNVELRSGLLMRFLGLTRVNIWTSSPAQIKIRNKQSEHTPDSFIVLYAEDAIWLQNFILNNNPIKLKKLIKK